MQRVLLYTVVALLGCGDDAPSRSPAPAGAPVQAEPSSILSLAAEPSFSIGLAEGPDEYLFSRIAGAVRVAGGDVVVAVQGYHEIRRFAPSGDHLWTIGREGAGPGEFRAVELLSECTTDSLVVARGTQNNTITMFDGDGSLIRTDRFERYPFGYRLTCAPSGRLVFSNRPPESRESLLYRVHQDIAYADAPDAPTVVLRSNIPAQDRFQEFDESGHAIMSGPRTWGRELVFAPTNDGVWIATGDDYEVEFLDWSGTTSRRIRWLGPPRNVTATHLDAFRERLCRGYRLLGRQDWQERCNRRYEAEEPNLPSTFPSVARLLVADDGRLWVEHFRRPGESREWLVFDGDGTWASSLRLPMRMFLQDAGRDWVLVRHTTDDLDVETLAIYTITSDRLGLRG